eukprot:TRINITY_DN7574_c0_g3_i3.p1 TRINITY_DN7574_c0_g3~~TRINITY_DN7574_c0_g3_i3.p1  ORF type:complete len:127 (-),score=14.29 TRINITY_DN7574_c0_g3_i3:532-912(-)
MLFAPSQLLFLIVHLSSSFFPLSLKNRTFKTHKGNFIQKTTHQITFCIIYFNQKASKYISWKAYPSTFLSYLFSSLFSATTNPSFLSSMQANSSMRPAALLPLPLFIYLLSFFPAFIESRNQILSS